jgi:alanine racemase
MKAPFPTWIEIDCGAVAENCARIIQDTGTPLMAVVKGDAYGYGAVEVSRAALSGGASWLGVARFGEARALRAAGIQAPILVLGMATEAEVDEAIASQVTLTLHSLETLQLFAARAGACQRPIRVHLKVDTGLGRLGVMAEDVVPLARQALGTGGILIDGMFSHLAAAEEQHPLNEIQQQRFAQAVNAMQEAGLRPTWIHLANSAAAFYIPQTRFNLVRSGNVVLGLRIRIDRPLPGGYRPALTWKAQLASCRLLPPGWGVGYGMTYVTGGEETIGVIPVGYGDGLRRVPGNQVLIGGKKVAVVGRLSLDQMMVRLPEAYPLGEEVVILGEQGSASIQVHDLAALYQISQVDLTTLIHARVPRIYK